MSGVPVCSAVCSLQYECAVGRIGIEYVPGQSPAESFINEKYVVYQIIDSGVLPYPILSAVSGFHNQTGISAYPAVIAVKKTSPLEVKFDGAVHAQPVLL